MLPAVEPWLGEIDRRHPDYVRWVQRSLNRIMGAGLVVDGIRGRNTRRAIRFFQRRHGLSVDGIVGSRTEAALMTAGAGPPPAMVQPEEIAIDRPQGPLGTLTITSPSQIRFQYTFTPEDALWIARMIKGEAGGRDDMDNEAVIWAMFNRYAFFTHKYYPTFTRFIRAYSTPLQPYLRNCGTVRHHMKSKRFERLGGTIGTKNCPDLPRGQLKRHLKLHRTPWQRLPAGARSLAERAVKGGVPNPICTASEFASTYIIYTRRNGRKPTHEEWRRYTMGFKEHRKFKWIGEKPGLNQKKNAFFSRTLRIPGSSQRYADLHCDTVRIVMP